MICWGGGREEGGLKQVVHYRAGETAGLDLKERRERPRSAVSLPASLARVACGYPENLPIFLTATSSKKLSILTICLFFFFQECF